MVILGIDPGTATTGYGIIKIASPADFTRGVERPRVIDFGCIVTAAHQLPGERLQHIYREVKRLIAKHQPELVSVETLFFFKNLKTAMPVSQARGVILLAAAEKKLPLYEFTPLQVKMTVAGYGGAHKKQVQKMTRELLNAGHLNHRENHRAKDDAADALGIAFCAAVQHLRRMRPVA